MSKNVKERTIVREAEVKQSMNSPFDQNMQLDGMMRLPRDFAGLNKLILRDLNGNNTSPSFYKYTKSEIATYLKNPYSYEKNLRNAVVYIYGASSHFRRLIQYFSSLTDFSYVVVPYGIDTSTAKPNTVKRNLNKVFKLLTSMDITNQFRKVLTVALREDVFYGTMWVTSDNVIIQQLPSDYCAISVIEDNVLNVTFDFQYFDTNAALLDMYPPEFKTKYELYQRQGRDYKWQELDSPTSFAIKVNTDILNYALPPFAGILREVYDLEDYKDLKLSATELENYAMLVMKLGINEQGEWTMPLGKAKEFWRNLDGVLPEQIGSVLSPMEIQKISFEKNRTGDTDTVSDAEQNIYSSAGVSSLLFNNEKASANALTLSIKVDQVLTYGVVKSIESVLNRFLRSQSYGKNFKMTFLDVSPWNRKEMGDMYLKACQYGMPMVSYYCASQGLPQAEMDTMNFLEDQVLGVKKRFIPLQSSSTQSSKTTTNETGRPQKDDDEITESGERTREEA